MRRILVTGAGGNAGRNFIASLRMAPEPIYVVGTDVSAMHLACADIDAAYLVPRVDDPDQPLLGGRGNERSVAREKLAARIAT